MSKCSNHLLLLTLWNDRRDMICEILSFMTGLIPHLRVTEVVIGPILYVARILANGLTSTTVTKYGHPKHWYGMSPSLWVWWLIGIYSVPAPGSVPTMWAVSDTAGLVKG